jgi:hypothetical protein
MKKILSCLAIVVLLISCEEQAKTETGFEVPEWSSKSVEVPINDSLVSGKTYLPVYSQVYSISEQRTLNLTVMASLRNVSDSQKVYLTRADYYSTSGDLIRKYLKQPVALNPLETTEIVINENDFTGGTGANFVFEWQVPAGADEPFFQAVMNSTMGQQGLSFTSEGIRMK